MMKNYVSESFPLSLIDSQATLPSRIQSTGEHFKSHEQLSTFLASLNSLLATI